MAFSSLGPIWISNNGSGTSTVYNGKNLGFRFPSLNQLVVAVPPCSASSTCSSTGSPTGIVFNNTKSDFMVSQKGMSGKAAFIFATSDGTISGWSPEVNLSTAVVAVDNSASGASYAGLALGTNSAGSNFLYAPNGSGLGAIDVFDKNFARATLTGSFTDPGLPAGFVPFNVQSIGPTWLYVTYVPTATSSPSEGLGLVDVFDTDGNFVRRFATSGTLNLPWGLALAPANFGQFSNDLLVGNLGDGRINAFDPITGNFVGQLSDPSGKIITIEFLWALAFGNGALAGRSNYLLYTAGSKGGLFGSIHPLGQ
jgi:uncharacterized protein (TIGR03118 family)